MCGFTNSDVTMHEREHVQRDNATSCCFDVAVFGVRAFDTKILRKNHSNTEQSNRKRAEQSKASTTSVPLQLKYKRTEQSLPNRKSMAIRRVTPGTTDPESWTTYGCRPNVYSGKKKKQSSCTHVNKCFKWRGGSVLAFRLFSLGCPSFSKEFA